MYNKIAITNSNSTSLNNKVSIDNDIRINDDNCISSSLTNFIGLISAVCLTKAALDTKTDNYCTRSNWFKHNY